MDPLREAVYEVGAKASLWNIMVLWFWIMVYGVVGFFAVKFIWRMIQSLLGGA